MKSKLREDYDPTQPVIVKVLSRSDDGGYLYPGQEYKLDDISDAAIACGIAYQADAEQPTKQTQSTKSGAAQ